MLCERRQVLFFKGPGSMVFELLFDVVDRLRYLRDANTKGSVSLLPGKVSQLRERLMDPS